MMTSLTLTITSPQKETMGALATKTFDCDGGTIGRAARNDWVLPEETVSSQHALVSFQDNEFTITDLSTNGVYINDSTESLGNGCSAPLNGVHTLAMGRYSIAVNIEMTDDSQETLIPVAEPNIQRATPLSESSFLDESADDPLDLLGSNTNRESFPGPADLPEDLFGDSSVTPLSQDQQAFENTPTPSVQDAFIAPGTHTEPVASASTIPDNWDQTSFSPAIKPEAIQAATEKPRKAISTPTEEIDIASQQTLVNQAMTKTPPEIPVTHKQEPFTGQDQPGDSTEEKPARRNSTDNTTTGNHTQYAQSPLTLAKAAFEQNGLDPSLLNDPDLVDQSLALLPAILNGILATLRSRAEVKNELRASQTILQPAENNPLKFSTDAKDAFYNLLINQRPGFLSPEESIKQAFEDLTRHEAALVLGIQTGLSGMLEKISPDAIESKISHLESKKNLFGKISSSKKWAYYKETYQHITENSDHSFIEMFGDDFVKGYEAFISNQKKNGN